MGIAKFLNKPEYLHNPFAVIRKVFRPTASDQLFTTRWHTTIMADWQDAIGGSIGLFGVYDLATTELLWRLIRPGNLVLDIGANIGYMTGLCSHRAGKNGAVWAFEPNLLLLPRLRGNISRAQYNNISLFEVGLSDKAGKAKLIIPKAYNNNAGIAYVAKQDEIITEEAIEIELRKLDDIIPEKTIVDVMKIDVEGHELSVFKGAPRLFAEKKIRHIVFEDLQEYPSEASKFLLQYGYKIFRIAKKINRLKLEDPHSIPSYKSKTTNYIATLEADVVLNAISGTGYKCMTGNNKNNRV